MNSAGIERRRARSSRAVRTASGVWNTLFQSVVPPSLSVDPAGLQAQLQRSVEAQVGSGVVNQLNGQLQSAQACVAQVQSLQQYNASLLEAAVAGVAANASASGEQLLSQLLAANGLGGSNDVDPESLLANASALAGNAAGAANAASGAANAASGAGVLAANDLLQQALGSADSTTCYGGIQLGDLTNPGGSGAAAQLTALGAQGPGLADAVVRDVLDSYGLSPLLSVVSGLAPQVRTLTQSLNASGQSQARTEQLAGLGAQIQGTVDAVQAGGTAEALRSLLLLLLSAGAPPPLTVQLTSSVATAELTAPLTGYGVLPTSGLGPTFWERRTM